MKIFEVIDNFLNVEDHQKIKDTLEDFDFSWHYSSWVSAFSDLNNKDFYFEHSFYHDYYVRSEHFDILRPILKKLNVKSLIRAKANLYTNIGPEIVKNAYHQDQNYSHLGAVYYVNTNNGYTGFEDGTKIESKANRILIFDPSILHHSTHCTDEKIRLTINFNYF